MTDLNTFVAWSPAILFLAYILVGIIMGRDYLWTAPSREKLDSYKDTRDTLLVLSGLILAALSVVVAISLNNLSPIQSVITYLSVALVSSLFGAYLVYNFETRNLFFYLGELAEYLTILSLGLAFYFFGLEVGELAIVVIFGIFLSGFLAMTAFNLWFYIEYWRAKDGKMKKLRFRSYDESDE